MEVFISHSMKDERLLQQIHNSMRFYGIVPLIAEHHFTPGISISSKVKSMIDRANMCLVLLTENGLYSGFVREEIGYMEARKKNSVIILEKGLEREYSGFKMGHDYIIHDPELPHQTVQRVNHELFHSKRQFVEEKNKKKTQNQFLVGVGVLAGLLILGASGE